MGCQFPVLAEIVVYFAERGEDIEINPIYNISWAVWILFRLSITLWWRSCFNKWIAEIDNKIVEMKENIKNKSLNEEQL